LLEICVLLLVILFIGTSNSCAKRSACSIIHQEYKVDTHRRICRKTFPADFDEFVQ
jgi:hypothetical protein